MPIIANTDLTSYLRQPGADVTIYVTLANGIVEELTGPFTGAPPARVTAITLEVAARAFRNPHGYSSETIDDYTYRRDAETRQAGVYLTAAEFAELSSLGGVTIGGAYTIPLGGPDVFL